MEGVLDLSTLIHNHNVQLFEYDDTPEAIYNILSKYIEKNQSSGAYYIVNLSNIKKKIMEWKQYLPNIKIFYAVKGGDAL